MRGVRRRGSRARPGAGSAELSPWGCAKPKPTGEAVTHGSHSAPWPSLLWAQTGKLWVTKAVRSRSRSSRAAPEDPQHLIAQTQFQLNDVIFENKTPRAAPATTALPGQLQLPKAPVSRSRAGVEPGWAEAKGPEEKEVLRATGVGRSLSPIPSPSPTEMEACYSTHCHGWGAQGGAEGGPVPGGESVRYLSWGHLTPKRAFPSPCCVVPALGLGTDVTQRAVALGGRGGSGEGVCSSPLKHPGVGQRVGAAPAAKVSFCPIALQRS